MKELALEQVRLNHYRKQVVQANQMDFFEIARANLGLHSTDYWTPYISAWSRIGNYDAGRVYTALNSGRSITRINAFRTTLHVVSNRDLLLIVSATGPVLFRSVRQGPEMRHLTERQIEQLLAKFLGLLDEQPLSMREIKAKAPALAKHSRSLLWLAMARGMVVRASTTHARNTTCKYALTDTWVNGLEGKMLSEEEAVTAVFHRYVGAFGPVTADDFAWWLPTQKTTAKKLIVAAGHCLQSCLVDGVVKYMLANDLETALAIEKGDAAQILLLPYEDHLPKAFADRTWFVDNDMRPKVFPHSAQAFWPQGATPKRAMPDTGGSGVNQSGEIRPSIWVDGHIVGRWEIDESEDRVRIAYSLFKRLPAETRRMIASKQSELEDFVNSRLMPISKGPPR